jgi:hypothetical protein
METETNKINSPVQIQRIMMKSLKEELMKFNQTLAQAPKIGEVKTHREGWRYIPIQVIEDKLDHFFQGHWIVKNFKYQVIANEMIGSLDLAVLHPVTGMWIERTGTGAVIIQQRVKKDDKGNRLPIDITDISSKIPNTLTRDMGHLKAECIKNAAKSLGRAFGSDVNREIDDGLLSPATTIGFEQFELDIQTIETRKELIDYYNGLPEILKRDRRVQALLKEREIDIRQNETAEN